MWQSWRGRWRVKGCTRVNQQTAGGSHLQSSSSSPDELTSLKSYKPSPMGFTEVTSDLWLIFYGLSGCPDRGRLYGGCIMQPFQKVRATENIPFITQPPDTSLPFLFIGLTDSSCKATLCPFVSSVLLFCSLLASVINNASLDFTWSDLCLGGTLQ